MALSSATATPPLVSPVQTGQPGGDDLTPPPGIERTQSDDSFHTAEIPVITLKQAADPVVEDGGVKTKWIFQGAEPVQLFEVFSDFVHFPELLSDTFLAATEGKPDSSGVVPVQFTAQKFGRKDTYTLLHELTPPTLDNPDARIEWRMPEQSTWMKQNEGYTVFHRVMTDEGPATEVAHYLKIIPNTWLPGAKALARSSAPGDIAVQFGAVRDHLNGSV